MTIPDSVTLVGSNVFQGCSNLVTVSLGNNFLAPTGLLRECSKLENVNIPSKWNNITMYMFYRCTSLKKLEFPSSILTINANAFNGCTSMQEYDFTASTSVVSLANTSAFTSIPSACKIVVPDDLYETWIARTNWSNFASHIIKESEWNA
jgi:hypothetical protein